MKTCLLLSGLPRFVDRGLAGILNNLIIPNNPDVFIHTWLEPGTNPGLERFIIDRFQPKKVLMERQRPFVNTHMVLDRMMASHGRSYPRDKFVEMVYSSWYSIQQANLLKEQYRLEHNINYDYTIRARFDIGYSHLVDCKMYDKNKIYISNRPDLPLEMIDDRFAFGSDALMNTYAGGFNLLDYVHEVRERQDGIFCGETLVFEMARMFGIPYKIIDSLHCGFIR
jgi:hypothetical protein